MIRDLVGNLDKHRFTMPPWCGRDEEADLLADYLYSIAPQHPMGMLPGARTKPGEAADDGPFPNNISPADNAAPRGE